MLVPSIFYFSHYVFYPSQNKFQVLSYIDLASANAFNLDKSKILSFSKALKCKSEEFMVRHRVNFLQKERSLLLMQMESIGREGAKHVPKKIKALKTLVWHLSSELMKKISSLKKRNKQ